jgi:acetyl esterase
MASRVDWRLKLVSWLSDRLDQPPEIAGPERTRARLRQTEPAFIFGVKRPMESIRDELLAGVPVRRYVPRNATDGVIAHFHGGGWVAGDVVAYDVVCRALAAEARAEVVSVDYRRSPEHRFPAALDDALAVTHALAQVHRQVAVAGDSAGGNLAAVVAQHFAREQRPLCAQLLVYPIVDCAAESPSYATWAAGPMLTRETMRYFVREYVPDPAQRGSPAVSPLRAESVAGVAPARVVLADCDVLRDEGRAYADKLLAAGVAVEVDELAGFVHGFFFLLGFAESRAALVRAGAWLRQHLA